MKKLLIVMAMSLSVLTVKSQSKEADFKMPSTLIMPDGSIVPATSIDSIRKVFGGRGLVLSMLEDGVHVHPAMTKAEQLDSETKLNSLTGNTAPGFPLKDIHGKSYSLTSLKGKIVVLNFWFTQCGGCITEMPDLNVLKSSYSDKDVVFLAITYDDSAKVKAFLAKNKFEYTIVPNAKNACTDYHIYGYPTSVVIDRNGVVRFINCSVDDDIKNQLTNAINKIKNNG